MTAPLVTVVIPSYNHARYIEASIRSVLRQAYAPLELIVIDDGSRDDSAQIIAPLAAQFGFRFETQSNQGLARTLNRAIALSHGKYLCTVGSDDILLPDKTEKQVAFMEAHPQIAVCGGNQLVIDSAGVIVNRRQRFEPQRILDFDDLFLQRKAGIPASSAMIRREILEREGGYDPQIPLEDMYLWYKLTARGHRIAGLNDVLLYYRKHDSNTYRNLRHMADSMLRIYAQYADHPQYQQVRLRYLSSQFLTAAKRDKAYARELLRQIPLRRFNRKVLRGLLWLLRP